MTPGMNQSTYVWWTTRTEGQCPIYGLFFILQAIKENHIFDLVI